MRSVTMPETSDEFGEFLVTCRRSWGVRVVQGFVSLFPMAGGGWLTWLAASCAWNGPAAAALPLMLCATLLGLLGWFLTLHIFVTLDFYERGLKWRSLLRRGEVRFEGAKRLDVKVIRAESHGAYAGSIAQLAIYPAKGKVFRWVGGYKSDPSSVAFAFLGVGARSDDPLTLARDVVAFHVAETLEAGLARGEHFDWAGGASVTSQGITWRRGDLVDWRRIVSWRADDERCEVDIAGEAKPRRMSCAGRNFYPGLVIVSRRIEGVRSI